MEKTHVVKCSKNHIHKVNISELEEILEWGSCPECGMNIIDVEPPDIEVECPICGFEESENWNSIIGWFYNSCPICEKNDLNSSIHIRGSFYYETEFYDNIATPVEIEKYKRADRPDYWEIVTHFCDRAELLSILRDGKIFARPTGYYGANAVCLTDTPIAYSKEIRNIHGDYGIAFMKRQIIENGGQPVIYLIDRLIESQKAFGGFSDDVKPFITLLRIPKTAPKLVRHRKIDYLHEREWRIAKDIDFDIIKPLGLILPDGSAQLKIAGNEWEILLKHIYKYGEINEL